MATKDPSGKRFGSDKQKDVTKKGTTNANKLTPSLRENVEKSVKEDVSRLKKGLAPAQNVGAARLSPQMAAGRALSRLGSRAGLAGMALGAGYDAGSAIADKAIEKMAEGKVKLSDYAKQRMKEEEDFKVMEAALRKADEDIRKEKEGKKMAKGGAVTTKKEDTKKKAEPMSPALLRAMKRYQEEEARRKMGERYDAIMPSPEPGEAKPKGMAKGGMTAKQQAKVGTVMKEFKAGSLHSGKGGKVVKSPKQAVAIALSEARKKK